MWQQRVICSFAKDVLTREKRKDLFSFSSPFRYLAFSSWGGGGGRIVCARLLSSLPSLRAIKLMPS